MNHRRIAVALDLSKGRSRRAQLHAPDPTRWSEEDARAFVWSVWTMLGARVAESFQVREIEPWTVYRLEFVTDSGAATSQPLMLSRRALGWLRSAAFGLGGETLH
jgi:hypothetical protein